MLCLFGNFAKVDNLSLKDVPLPEDEDDNMAPAAPM